MSSASPCPNHDELRLFLMGQLVDPDVASVETHVSECEDCVAVLSNLQAGDPFESAIREAAHRAKPADPDADRLVARIVGAMDSHSQSLSTTASAAASSPTYLDLSWLSPPEADDELGRVGGFRVLRVIGQGGMGVVFEAEDLKLQRRLALKVMLPKAAADPAGAARFLREARASAKVRHPNVVTVYQADSFGTVPFIAMELLRGESLYERLRRVGQLPLKDVLNLGRQIALGLAAAHTQELLHRDIKPANIWLEQTEDGDVIAKVLDFGLARSVEGDGSLTQSGMIVGTPQYMAPEQARGATPNIRSDLFSLGCVFYQMTTGRQPFVGRNVLDQLRALAVDVPPQVSELRDNAPSELSRLIHQLLEKVPSSRPASATEVAERLREIATPQVQSPQVNHWSWQRWTLVAIAVTVVLSVAGIALRENRPAGDGTQSISPTSATAQPLVTKPEASGLTPRDKPAIDSVDLPSSKPKLHGLANERARDVLKAADVKRFDVQLFWTGNEKQENISVKTAFLDGREPTTILNFQKKWGLNDFADITIDENARRIYLGLPREENRDARIVSFDYDGHHVREELQSNFVWSMCVDESRQRLYVSGAGPSGIFSIPLSGNGTDRHQFTIPKTFYANGLTVDPIEQKVYWVDPGPGVRTGGRLQRSNLEGTVVESVMTGLLEPTGLALDPIAKTIYWVEGYPPRVKSANYDGTNAKTLVAGESTNREDNYWDIAFDKPSGKLYFISRAAISRCDRDGSNLERLFAPGGDCLKIARGTSSLASKTTVQKPAADKTVPVETSKIQLDGDQTISRSVPRKWREVQSIDKDDGTLGAVVYGIALSPDGKLLATGDAGQVLRLWDVDTGKMRREIRNPLPAASEAMSPVFLKDGKRFVFVFARHRLAELWGVDSDKPLSVFQSDPNSLTSTITVSPNEDFLVTTGSTGPQGVATLWSLQTGKPIRRIESGLSGWPIVAFTSDGSKVACGSTESKVVSICDCSSGQKVGTLSGHTEKVFAIATGRVGKFIATAGRDGTIRLWSVSSEKQLRQISVDKASIKPLAMGPDAKSFAMSPDERLIAAGLGDGSVVIWDSETERQLDVLKTNLARIAFVTFSLDGRRLAASGDRSNFRIWQAEF